MKQVVMYSGGLGSWATAYAVKHMMADDDELILLFADTLMEDEDLYRFLDDGARALGVPVTRIADGRDPWQVFFDRRYLGNTRTDPCSYVLKRKLMRTWLEQNCDPAETTVYIGIDFTEAHRYTKAQRYWAPWSCYAPLIQVLANRPVQQSWAAEHELRMPRLYDLGFSHNNCGGFCIKAGMGHFKILLEKLPERYAYHEQKEQDIQEHLGKRVTILRDRSGGKVTPLSLREFRHRVQGGAEVDDYDIGGCNCVNPDAEVDAEIERDGAEPREAPWSISVIVLPVASATSAWTTTTTASTSSTARTSSWRKSAGFSPKKWCQPCTSSPKTQRRDLVTSAAATPSP